MRVLLFLRLIHPLPAVRVRLAAGSADRYGWGRNSTLEGGAVSRVAGEQEGDQPLRLRRR
jgi:hypothetical protein